jgi:hypothetical protein
MGGILYPDSDLDGLSDGDEYYIYHTHPGNADTDHDGYADGLEISLGLDPLSYTSKEDFQMALAQERGSTTMQILSPGNGTIGYQNTVVNVVNYTFFQDMWFRYENGSDWYGNVSLVYNPASQTWYNNTVRWSPGTYEIQVFARDIDGVIHAKTAYFTVQAGDDPWPMYWLIIGAALVGLVVILIVIDVKTHKVRGGLRWFVNKITFGRIGGKADTTPKPTGKKDTKPAAKKEKPATSAKAKKKKADSPSKGKKGGA